VLPGFWFKTELQGTCAAPNCFHQSYNFLWQLAFRNSGARSPSHNIRLASEQARLDAGICWADGWKWLLGDGDVGLGAADQVRKERSYCHQSRDNGSTGPRDDQGPLANADGPNRGSRLDGVGSSVWRPREPGMQKGQGEINGRPTRGGHSRDSESIIRVFK